MANFVLNDLGGPAGKGFDAGLKLLVLPLYLNGLVTPARTRAAQQRKATFFCVVRIGLLNHYTTYLTKTEQQSYLIGEIR